MLCARPIDILSAANTRTLGVFFAEFFLRVCLGKLGRHLGSKRKWVGRSPSLIPPVYCIAHITILTCDFFTRISNNSQLLRGIPQSVGFFFI